MIRDVREIFIGGFQIVSGALCFTQISRLGNAVHGLTTHDANAGGLRPIKGVFWTEVDAYCLNSF